MEVRRDWGRWLYWSREREPGFNAGERLVEAIGAKFPDIDLLSRASLHARCPVVQPLLLNRHIVNPIKHLNLPGDKPSGNPYQHRRGLAPEFRAELNTRRMIITPGDSTFDIGKLGPLGVRKFGRSTSLGPQGFRCIRIGLITGEPAFACRHPSKGCLEMSEPVHIRLFGRNHIACIQSSYR